MGEKPKEFTRSFAPLTDPKWSQVVQIVVADYDYSSAIGAVGLLPDGQVITWKNEHQPSHPKTLF